MDDTGQLSKAVPLHYAWFGHPGCSAFITISCTLYRRESKGKVKSSP